MTEYLVGPETFETWDKLRRVEATSANEAMKIYRITEYPICEDYREHIADKCINMSFAERFWLSEEDNHVEVTTEVFKQRVRDTLKMRPDLAEGYIEYALSDSEEFNANLLPAGLLEFLAEFDVVSNWIKLIAIPISLIAKSN